MLCRPSIAWPSFAVAHRSMAPPHRSNTLHTKPHIAATMTALAAGGATNPTLLAARGAQQQQPRSVAGGMPASVLSDGGCSRAGGSWRRSQARRSLLVTRAVGDDDAPSVMGES